MFKLVQWTLRGSTCVLYACAPVLTHACLHSYRANVCKHTFLSLPHSGKVSQVDGEKMQPRVGASFLCIRDLSLPSRGWGVLNHTTPSSIKTAFVLYCTGLSHLNNIPADANTWKWSTAQVLCGTQLWQGGHSQLVFSSAATCTYIIVITFWVPSVRWQKYASHRPTLCVKHKAIL